MKTFTFLIWIIAFFTVSGILLFTLPNAVTFNGMIYLLCMIVLLTICVVGALLDLPANNNPKNKFFTKGA